MEISHKTYGFGIVESTFEDKYLVLFATGVRQTVLISECAQIINS